MALTDAERQLMVVQRRYKIDAGFFQRPSVIDYIVLAGFGLSLFFAQTQLSAVGEGSFTER